MPISAFAEGQPASSGTIILWDGLLSDIPSGWVLCDGNNGTPNLLDQFTRSVPDSATDPGTTGGTASVTLSTSQLPTHSHSGSTSSDGSHYHTVNPMVGSKYDQGGGAYTYYPLDEVSAAPSRSNGGHSHTVSVGDTGSGNSIENRPSSYQLAYIMKT